MWVGSWLVGCAAKQAEPPASAASSTSVAASRPSSSTTSTRGLLYSPEEALRDALSGPGEYLGTGQWPGIRRMQACAFRNARVIIVNVYCTITEQQAFRIDVYSPSRGRVRIYAESKGPVSKHTRREYFTFTVESEPPPGPSTRLRPVALGMSFPELRDYDEARYEAYLPACHGGTELNEQKKSGCLESLAAHAPEWSAQSKNFLERPNDDWYRMVREMRELAARYGKEPE